MEDTYQFGQRLTCYEDTGKSRMGPVSYRYLQLRCN